MGARMDIHVVIIKYCWLHAACSLMKRAHVLMEVEMIVVIVFVLSLFVFSIFLSIRDQ